jgi:hypothetical protein
MAGDALKLIMPYSLGVFIFLYIFLNQPCPKSNEVAIFTKSTKSKIIKILNLLAMDIIF